MNEPTSKLGRARARDTALPDNAPHVLVVDDDQRIRDLLGRFLLENGFRVTTAEDAACARAMLKGLAFDILILDVMMPGNPASSLPNGCRANAIFPS